MSRRRTARTHDDYPTRPDLPLAGRAATHDDDPCPGPCNHDFRRAELDHEHHDVPFHPGRPTWCTDQPAFNHRGEALPTLAHHGCTTLILDQLRALPDLAANLTPGRLNTPRDTDIDHGSSKNGGARALSHAPSPSPGWDTADELVRWAIHLEDWLRERLDQPGPWKAYRTLTESVAYLHGHGTALLASPRAEEVGRQILGSHRRLERLVGQDRLTHRMQEPCPRCARKGLRRKDGDELVKCVGCRAVWDWDHFQLLARTYAETVQSGGGTA